MKNFFSSSVLKSFPFGKGFGIGLLLLFSFSFTKAQWVTIPDANMVATLQFYVPGICWSGNQLDTTCVGVVNTTSLPLFSGNISNLDGIAVPESVEK